MMYDYFNIHIFSIPFDRWEHLIYQFGEHDHLIQMIVKDGVVAYDQSETSE